MTTRCFCLCFDGVWLFKDGLFLQLLALVVYFEEHIQVLVMLFRVLPYLALIVHTLDLFS